MNEPRSIVLRLTTRLKVRLMLLAIILLLLQVAMFYLGSIYGSEDGFSLRSQQRELVRQVNQQTMALKEKSAESVRLQKSSEIDRLAAEQVRQELAQLREQVANLQKDVEFYRGLMAPGERERGLKLHSFELLRDPATGLFNHRLVLANIGGRSIVKGTLRIDLEMLEGDRRQLVSLTEAPDYSGANPIKLRFRFFQNIEGAFRLADNVEPLALFISANVKDASGELFKLRYNWQDLIAHEHSGG